MSIRVGVVMDPIDTIKIHKDSTFAMLLAAQARGWSTYYMQLRDLYLRDERSWGCMAAIRVMDDPQGWFEAESPTDRPLDELDVILMRKDPPFDMEYIYATYLLERAEIQGTLVVNRPRALRDANEKLFTAWFPQCCPPTLVTRDAARIRQFVGEHGDIILKPLGSMGGTSIFRVRHGDPNTNVIIETLVGARQDRFAMAQRFIPEIRQGDKRILLVDGQAVPYALARVPPAGETRGNLAVGGRGEGIALSERDYRVCEQVAPELRRRGLLFVGLDVIGDYLTEINVTSPTCIRELDALYGLDIGSQLMDTIEQKLS